MGATPTHPAGGHRLSISIGPLLILVTTLCFLSIAILTNVSSGSGDVVDNFEWKAPGTGQWTGYDQFTEAVLSDAVTGEVYIVFMNREKQTYMPREGVVICARLDQDRGELVNQWVINYTGNDFASMSLTDRAYLVHDGRFYFLFYTSEDMLLHLRINNETTDRVSWYFPSSQYRPLPPHYRIIGVENEQFLFMEMEDLDGMTSFRKYAVDIDDFQWTRLTEMTVDFDCIRVKYLLRNGELYFLMNRDLGNNRYGLVLDRINMTTGERQFLINIQIEKQIWYREIVFDLDLQGDLHLWDDNSQILYKISTTGEITSTINLTTLWGGDSNPHPLQSVNIIANMSGCLYLIARTFSYDFNDYIIASFVISSNYQGKVLRHDVSGAGVRMGYSHRHIDMNETGSIVVAWYSIVDDLSRVLYSH